MLQLEDHCEGNDGEGKDRHAEDQPLEPGRFVQVHIRGVGHDDGAERRH